MTGRVPSTGGARNAAERLYIIGNGFDRHHGVPSDYRDFARYLQAVDRETYGLVEEYFSPDDDFWWEFETRLADFDTEAVLDYAASFLVSYGADDWSDAYHHDYEYEIDRVASGVSVTLRRRFADWVRTLPAASAPASGRLDVDPAARFLTFNYTPTLQTLYSVPGGSVLHIHGSAADPTAQLVLGHGWESNPSSRVGEIDEDTDTRVAGGFERIDRYFRDTFKPTEAIIAAHRPFFEALTSVSEVWVLGHSLAEVDQPYFDAVVAATDPRSTRWRISFHTDAARSEARFASSGVDPRLATFEPLTRFRARVTKHSVSP